jgi:secreted PhoX family phosphatase
MNRRHFTMLATAFAFSGLAKCQTGGNNAANMSSQAIKGYGRLIKDPNGLLDLPEGFSYKIISEYGTIMDDGMQVPDRADGMGCFAVSDTRVALIRNHELSSDHFDDGPMAKVSEAKAAEAKTTGKKTTEAKTGFSSLTYDHLGDNTPLPGGTTTTVYDLEKRAVTHEYLSLTGTIRNCSGGITPWGTWLTCEENVTRAGEDVQKDHGWVFEVPAPTAETLASSENSNPVSAAKPLKALGRFNHEAAAVDPKTGIVYLTEDRGDSLFYRFIPNEYGKLDKGGRLQAMAFHNASYKNDSTNSDNIDWQPGEWRDTKWIDLNNPESPEDDLRIQGFDKGAVIFARGEGIHWGDGELYFCCTSGGQAGYGQIMRYQPSPKEGLEREGQASGKIQLFVESTDPSLFNFGDNLTVAQNGHLFVCEDQYTLNAENHIRGVNPDGFLYDFGRIRIQTEPAGACFSPDGKTLFVNLYSPAKTLAITGPWSTISEQKL